MGRKTWDSIPEKYRPLRQRLNVVISSTLKQETILDGEENDDSKDNSSVLVFDSIEKAMTEIDEIRKNENIEKVFLIGGSSLYHQALRKDLVDEMYITKVKGNYDVDTYFPLFNLSPDSCCFVKVENDFMKNKPIKVEDCTFEKYVKNPELEKKKMDASVLSEIEVNDENQEPDSSEKNIDNIAEQDQKECVEQDEMTLLKIRIEEGLSKHEEYQYLNLVLDCIMNGNKKMDRTKVGTHSVFGRTMRFSLADNVFPLLTTKTTFFRGVAEELLFFIAGQTDNKLLQEKKVHIWDLNCTREFLDKLGLEDREENDLGPVYGFQWRHFGADYTDCKADYAGQGVDQLKNVIETLKKNPNSRRIILSAWNVTDMKKMVLPPCHMFAQFYVHDNKLSCQMYQRSADLGLGVPFNIASYALLTRMIAQCCDLEAHEFVHVIGDCHVYNNHVEKLKIQLVREPRAFPKLLLNPEIKNIEDFKYGDFELVGYKPHKKIKMAMAV